MKVLQPYLVYEKFTVHTDHAALQWLFSIQDPSGRLMRWRLRLCEYDFEIAYKKGPQNQQADALSRLQTLAETVRHDDDEIQTFLLESTHAAHTKLTRKLQTRIVAVITLCLRMNC